MSFDDATMDADPKAQKRIMEMIEGCEREIEVLRRIDREQAEADAREQAQIAKEAIEFTENGYNYTQERAA